MATRSPNFLMWEKMIDACARADIVVSDRRLPSACKPRWLKLDRKQLARSGGFAIHLGSTPRVVSVADLTHGHPWGPAGQ